MRGLVETVSEEIHYSCFGPRATHPSLAHGLNRFGARYAQQPTINNMRKQPHET